MKHCLADLTYAEIVDLVSKENIEAYRADQLQNMILKCKTYDETTNIPRALKDALSTVYDARAVELECEYCGKDNVKKYLFKLRDGYTIESVYMPHGYGDTVCVSTQVGCKMGCVFCASGIGGLVRNLTPAEILGQVLLAERLNAREDGKRAITNIVLMGSGEPLDNYENVLRFILLVSNCKGLNVSPRNISLSTVGVPGKIEQLADSGFQITLAISLHAPTDEKRNKLIPHNRKFGISDIIKATKYYFEKTHRRIIFEYALTDGENSDIKSAEQLVALIKGLPCHVNLIPLNPVKEKRLRTASRINQQTFLDFLTKERISATIRRSMGSDIAGACGQLRNQFVGDKAVNETQK
ncbi:MAG: 23S rRNA (adenine(2503)-C(2))-methyltransferase RlmN [Christensenellaceae bacterium]|jgi:23S rRNA (adenine2503-C2)-methyltransferase|nr:23S rRNA (adenine(2503)-C(2))-methyltransferase RlmN [Christensenellaceae bacterium]